MQRRIGQDPVLRKLSDSGATVHRYQEQDLRLEYIVRPEREPFISRAELGPRQIGKRLDAATVQKRLAVSGELPASWETACDRETLTGKRRGGEIVSLAIEVDVD